MLRQTEMVVKYILVIDLEATCCDHNTIPRREMEIIEIGAVMVAYPSLEPVSEFQSFVKPLRNRELTSFCTELTSITQEQVENAASFPEVMYALIDWMAGFEGWIFASWGAWDRGQFEQDCDFHGFPYPFGAQHLNIKTMFAARAGTRSRGMARALEQVGLAVEGTHHRGIDDARNIARLLPYALEMP